MQRTSNREDVSTKLSRIAELARKAPGMVLKTLAHHVDTDFLLEAHRRTRKDGAPGVDGRTAADFEQGLGEKLQALEDGLKSGDFRAPPVRRVHIPKEDGKTRPLGIPTYEDKVLQRAVTMVLEAVYEQDFHDCSYGFRPNRSAHDALEAIWKGSMDLRGGWVLDADIKSYFDSIDHAQLRAILDKRVKDGVIRRAIDKWLAAGVLENGSVSYPNEGTPQGGVISPLLANIFLHEVLDEWWVKDVKPRLKGRGVLVRYADDFVIIFEREEDARRVIDVLPKRFGKYGLTLHPEKTRLVRFTRPKQGDGDDDGPGSFDFLGMTHYWALSKKGNWVVKRKTARKRFTRTLVRIREWLRRHMHAPLEEQWAGLSSKLLGHGAYFGVIGNEHALHRIRDEVRRAWWDTLQRRSNSRRLKLSECIAVSKRYPLPRLHTRYRWSPFANVST